MSESLREQLLRLGLKPAPAKPRTEAKASAPAGRRPREAADSAGGKPKPGQGPAQSASRPTAPSKPRREAGPPGEIDLARAYALREREQRAEQEAARRAAEKAAAARRERRRRLRELTEGQSLNAKDAEIARHFPHGGKIKRIYVTQEQWSRLNAGELGVVQIEGRFQLVARSIALAVQEVASDALVLLPDPDADSAADDGSVD